MNIKCNTKGCMCPSASRNKKMYTFTYVDNDINCIYYDVPKSGSTTIRDIFFPHAWPNGSKPCISSVLTPIYKNKKYTTFTFVRNPFDRIVSVWKHFTQRDYHIKQLKRSNIDIEKCKDFNNFIEMIQLLDNHHWQPQSNFIPGDTQFIGKIETFDDDYTLLCKLLNREKKKLIHTNKTSRGPYTQYYNDDLVQIVSEIYAGDLERFDYKFGE